MLGAIDTDILLELVSQTKELKGKTRLQKLVFLCQQEFDGEFDYEFVPAQFGPLSYRLNHVIQRAKRMNFVAETLGHTDGGNPVFSYMLTADGQSFLEYLTGTRVITAKLRESIKNTISEYGAMSFGGLLDYVHMKYPDLRLKPY